ncbi:unnamed protein product [Urochloa decumbens]|uniref:Uncharacterized protein n=1 Tax=Urochloa decumbens TaxID=240449 RepID=A0ABC9CQN1_9POAL
MDMEHEDAAVSYLSYDEYVLFDEDGNRLVSRDYEVPVENSDFLFVHSPEFFAVENGVLVLPGETENYMRQEVVAEVTKKISRNMLKAIWKNHSRSKYFTAFDASHVRTNADGKVKFRGVSIVRSQSAGELKEHTTENLLSVCTIISNMFNGNLPDDFANLLSLIKKGTNMDIYHIHAALVPLINYDSLFIELYDHIFDVLDKVKFREILAELKKLPYVQNWKTTVQDNDLLNITYSFNDGGSSYDVPVHKVNPNKKAKPTCLNKDQNLALEKLGLKREKGQADLYKNQIDLLEAMYFLMFLRNRIAHRMEPFKDWIEADANGEGGRDAYDPQGSALVTHLRFPLVLAFMQEQLLEKNELWRLPIANYF